MMRPSLICLDRKLNFRLTYVLTCQENFMKLVTVCLSLLVFQFSFAQDPQFAPQPTEPALTDHQQAAVQQNNHRQTRAKRIKTHAKKDGVITRKERKKIKHAKNHARAIHKKKNK